MLTSAGAQRSSEGWRSRLEREKPHLWPASASRRQPGRRRAAQLPTLGDHGVDKIGLGTPWIGEPAGGTPDGTRCADLWKPVALRSLRHRQERWRSHPGARFRPPLCMVAGPASSSLQRTGGWPQSTRCTTPHRAAPGEALCVICIATPARRRPNRGGRHAPVVGVDERVGHWGAFDVGDELVGVEHVASGVYDLSSGQPSPANAAATSRRSTPEPFPDLATSTARVVRSSARLRVGHSIDGACHRRRAVERSRHVRVPRAVPRATQQWPRPTCRIRRIRDRQPHRSGPPRRLPRTAGQRRAPGIPGDMGLILIHHTALSPGLLVDLGRGCDDLGR